MLISYEDATQAMKPHYLALWKVINESWQKWLALAPELRLELSARSRASIVHDFMVNRALLIANPAGQMWPNNYRGMFTLGFESSHGAIALRLKKFDSDALSKNNPTQQTKDFRHQTEISGVPAKFHLEVGYILTAAQDKIQSIELVCPSGSGNYWRAEITPKAMSETEVQLWENQGEQEQLNTGFTVIKRELPGDLQGENNGQSSITKTGTDAL